MKGITSRLQVFLAKIAGKEVDVSTLTPPVAINEEEKLMLDIADRIDAIEEGGGGGGGDGGVFIVHASLEWNDTTSKFDVITEEQDNDIIAAITAGKIVELHVGRYGNNPFTDFETYPLLDAYLGDESDISIDFGFPLEADFQTNNIEFKKTGVSYYNGVWEYSETIKSLNAP